MLSVLGGRGDELKKKYFIGLSERGLHIYEGDGSDPCVKGNRGLSGTWHSREASAAGAACGGDGRWRGRGPACFRGGANETRKSSLRWWVIRPVAC